MNTALAHVGEIFDRLRRGHHLSLEDEPLFSAVAANYEEYATFFAAIKLTLVRHPRDFFYFAPEPGDKVPDGLPRIAVFSYILIDHAANIGRNLEEYIFTQHFLVSQLPHFSLDRYCVLLKQVDIRDIQGLRPTLRQMHRMGWLKFLDGEEFRFLRPFHRMLDKCLELSGPRPWAGNAEPAAGSTS